MGQVTRRGRRNVPNWREPHWSEGMLLLPQHLQVSHRYWEAMLGEAWRTSNAFSWGFDELILSDAQIREGEIGVERATLRTHDGTWAVVPENAEIAPRKLDEHLAGSPDGLMVYLAVPRLREHRPNAQYTTEKDGQQTRYRVERVELWDENTGDNAQQVETHALQTCLLFGAESERPGYETLPMARVYLSGEEGGVPKRDASYVPPLMRMGASDDLQRLIRDVVHEAGARARELAAEAKKEGMKLSSGVGEHIERLLMLHTLNQALGWFRQVMAIPEARPHVVYAELCRLAGSLSIFSDDLVIMDYPPYDHFRIGENFGQVCGHILELFQRLSVGRVKWRDFQPRDDGEGLQVPLEEDWVARRRDLYVGVVCTSMDEAELDMLLKGLNWKIASIGEVDQLYRAGLPGLTLRPVRTATGILPGDAAIKYYQIMYDEERWPKIEANKVLAIRYSPDAQSKLEDIAFRIYVVLEK